MIQDRIAVAVIAFVFGLAFGSFGNVVIWRFPRRESLSSPGSHCPACNAPISWRDNIPVVSWIVLRGRCRQCGSRIHWRYPVVEALVGLLWGAAVLEFGVTPVAAMAALMFYLLVILAFIDLDLRRLPNPIVAMLGVVGLSGCLVAQLMDVPLLPLTPVGGFASPPLLAAMTGTLSAAGVSLAIALVYSSMRGRTGLGMGDVKLLAALGPFLGVYTIGVLVIGSLFGTVWGIIAAARSGEGVGTKFAFGPCLAAAAVAVAFVGPESWGWYARLAGLS